MNDVPGEEDDERDTVEGAHAVEVDTEDFVFRQLPGQDFHG